jgi:hypothetical protein
MFDFDTQEKPARSRAGYRRERRHNRRSAFQLACLTAGLVTAFAGGIAAPAHADLPSELPDFITTSTGLQVFDGSEYFAAGSSYSSTPITTQGNAIFGANDTAVVIFSQSPQLFIGQSFEGFFNADEGTIVNDIQNQTYTGPDWDNFKATLIGLSLVSTDNNIPITAVVFSNGAYGGTVSGTTMTYNSNGGFGIAAEPNAPTVPEPGTMATMSMGFLGIAGAVFARMRRRRMES